MNVRILCIRRPDDYTEHTIEAPLNLNVELHTIDLGSAFDITKLGEAAEEDVLNWIDDHRERLRGIPPGRVHDAFEGAIDEVQDELDRLSDDDDQIDAATGEGRR